MADDVFKLPGSSFETVCKVIMSYTQVGNKTGLSEIAKIMGTDPTTVSRNISFLVAVGLLEGGRDKQITPLGSRLGRALEFRQEEQSSRAWRDALVDVPLVQRILSAIRVRGGMDATTLQTQIVYTAGVSKTGGAMTGGAAVVEMLKAANLISERDGKFIAPASPEHTAHTSPEMSESVVEHTNVVERRVVVSETSGDVQLRVEVRLNVSTTPDELGTIGKNLRQLIDDLNADSRAGRVAEEDPDEQ